MVAHSEHQTALSRLSHEAGIFARLAQRLEDLQQEENQLREQLRHPDQHDTDNGEIVTDAATLIASNGPITSPRSSSITRLQEVLTLQPQVKNAMGRQDELIRALQRDASREVVMGAEGDRWRKAVKQLAKVVKELAEADAAVAEETQGLARILPDPESLRTIRFPAGAVYNFEPGDLPRVCANFNARLIETDRYYTA